MSDYDWRKDPKNLPPPPKQNASQSGSGNKDIFPHSKNRMRLDDDYARLELDKAFNNQNVEYQTFRKSDLQDAINDELAAWDEINKDVPPHLRSIVLPRALEIAGTWPLVEESMEARRQLKIAELERLAKLNDEIMAENMESMTELTKTLRMFNGERFGKDFKGMPEPPNKDASQFRNNSHLRQNASQYHTGGNDKPKNHVRWPGEGRGMTVGEAQKLIQDALSELGQKMGKRKNSPKWLDPEYSMTKEEINYQYLLADIKKTRMEHWGNLLEDDVEDSKPRHWLWKYCFPYVGASAIIAAIVHFITFR